SSSRTSGAHVRRRRANSDPAAYRRRGCPEGKNRSRSQRSVEGGVNVVEVVRGRASAVLHARPALSWHPDALLPDHVLDVQAAVVLDQVVADAVAGGPGDHDVRGRTGVVVRMGARAAPTEGLELGELRAHGPVAVDGV